MKNLLAGLGAALLLTACATQQTGTTAQQTAQTPVQPQLKGRRLEILFLGDNGHHQPIKMAPYAMAALGNRGINFTYTDRLEDLNPANLAKFDGLLLFANWDSIPRPQEQALLDYVAGGRGLIAVHCASWCFRNSEPLVRMMGGQFWRHTWDTIRPVWVKPEHPALAGTKPVSTLDETYLHQKLQPDNLVLTERLIQPDQAKDRPGQTTEPYTWVRTHGKGRVFYTAYGHDQNTWANADFENLLEKGIKWAVGEEANRALAALNPQPFKYHEANLPNYERRPGPQLEQEPLSPEESMKHLQVHPDFNLSLVASEPGIQHPIAMAWDEQARPFVIVTLDYPNARKPEGQGSDFILRLDDTDGDGKTDRYVKFAENLSMPTSLVAYDGGFIVSQAPDMLYLKDTDGDGKADLRKVLFTGFGTFDTHAGPSNLHYGFDNYVYGSVGYAGFKGTVGGKTHNFTQGFFRFRPGLDGPDGSELEFLTATSNNTWGLAFDEAGNLFGSTANNDHGWYMAIPNRYLAGVEKLRQRGGRGIDTHKDMKPLARIRQVDVFGGFTAAAGHNFYTARAFPKPYWNRVAFVAEPTGHLVHQNPVEKAGTDFSDKNDFNLIAGADEWFSPVFAETGPDGAVYVLDWYSFIIQHNPTPKGFENGEGNAYKTDLRDNSHGRLYRISYKAAPAYTPLSLSKDRPDALVAALRNNNLFWRLTAQRLLVERGKTDVLPQLLALTKDQTRDELGLSPAAIHALWTLHGLAALNGSNADALRAATDALRHPDPAVRKTAVQVLPATDATAQALLAAHSLQDAEPLVVLNTVLKLSETTPTPAVDAALAGLFENKAFLNDRWLPDALTATATAHQFRGLRSLLAKAPRKAASSGAARVGGAMNHEGMHHPLPPEGGSSAGVKNPLQGAGGGGDKPDLIITAIRATPANPTVQETVRLSVEVENRGGGTVPKGTPIPLAIRIEGPGKTVDLVSETFTDGLAPGAKASIAEVTNGPWKGGLTMYSDAPGEFTVSVQADPAGRIPETSDTNNAFRQKITYAPLASLTGYVLENAARSYAAVSPVDSVVALVASLQTVNDGDAKAVLTGLNRAVDPKATVTIQPADRQVLARIEPKFSPENQSLLDKLLVAWGLKTDAAADPNTQVVRMKVVPEKLQFDKKEFTVEAGRPVEIIVENPDQMQHNLVIGKPRSLEVIGAAADKLITMPNGQLRNYVPEIPQVVAATRLINPDESVRLQFAAPTELGLYPFVCTFPGHWRVMNGVMRVVRAAVRAEVGKK